MSADPQRANIDTHPVSPRAPDPLILAAMRDVPRVMSDMESDHAAGAGEKTVIYCRLVKSLMEKRGHAKAAAEWAIDLLVKEGKLTARYAWHSLPASVGRGSRGLFGLPNTPGHLIHAPPDYECRDLQQSWIGSTPALWDWWNELESAPPAGPPGS